MGGDFEGVLDLRQRTQVSRHAKGRAQEFLGTTIRRRTSADAACEIARRSRAGAGRLSRVRRRGLSPRRPDAGLFRLGAEEFRRRRADRRARRLRAAAAAAAGRAGADRARRDEVTGFVFKVQANMDPNHRDRIAFMRLCLGHLQTRHEADADRAPASRSRSIRRSCSSRRTARSPTRPWPGDIIGIPNHGTLRVGDTLTEKATIVRFTGLPNFAPEILRRVALKDPTKTKQLRKALDDLAEEGVIQVFYPEIGAQLDRRRGRPAPARGAAVSRLEAEYKVEAGLEPAPFETARWVSAAEPADLKAFMDLNRDVDGQGSRRQPGLSREDGLGRRLCRRSLSQGEIRGDARALSVGPVSASKRGRQMGLHEMAEFRADFPCSWRLTGKEQGRFYFLARFWPFCWIFSANLMRLFNALKPAFPVIQ